MHIFFVQLMWLGDDHARREAARKVNKAKATAYYETWRRLKATAVVPFASESTDGQFSY